jgi:hypothetical protein
VVCNVAVTRTSFTRLPLAVLAAALIAAVGIPLLAGSPAGAAAKPQKLTASQQKAVKTYESCLAEHGVKLPSTSGSHHFSPPSGGFPHGSYPGGFSGGSYPGGSYPGGSFPHGSYPGGSFPHGSYPGGGFPGFSHGSTSSSKYEKAFNACKSKLPKGVHGFGFGSFGGQNGSAGAPTAAQKQALSAYESCMTAHGVKIASTATFQTIRSLLAADKGAASANTACQGDLRAAFAPSATRPSGTSTS